MILLILGLIGCATVKSGETPSAPQEDAAMKMRLEISGEGTPLVIVGGGLTGVLSWTTHAERLSPRHHVALAQPLGVQLGLENAPLPANYSVRMESRALAAGLDQAGWTEPVDLVGWSYGGLIALDFALERPERIRSLVLMEPDAAWSLPDYGRSDPEVRKVEEDALRWADGVTEDELTAMMSEMLGPGQSPREHPRWPVWNAHRNALRASTAIFRHHDDPARLRRFSKPVLLVKGKGTLRYNAVIVDTLARAFPIVRVVELPGGHMAPIVAGDRFLEEMEAFQRAPGSPPDDRSH